MGGSDDLRQVDPGLLSRAPCERPSSRSHINPWADGRPPGPISGDDIHQLDQLGWIPHPQPPPVPPPPVSLQEFNLSTSKFVRPGSLLGKNPFPTSTVPFINAVELIFQVEPSAVARMKILDFRPKQEIESEEAWQLRLDEGPGKWVEIGTSPVQPDGIDLPNQVVKLPVVCFYDNPGLVGTKDNEQFILMGKVRSDPHAVRLVLRQNFSAWVEGQFILAGNKKEWRRISEKIDWHSNQGLIRNIFADGKTWASDANTDIGLGHTSGPPTQ